MANWFVKIVLGFGLYQAINSYTEAQNGIKSIPKYWSRQWNGRTENLTLAYQDEHVLFYIQNIHLPNSSALYHTISRAWKHAKDINGPFDNHTILVVVLHRNTAANDNECSIAVSNESVSQNYQSSNFDTRHLIDCGPSLYTTWNTNSKEGNAKLGILDEILNELALMELKLNHWPGRKASGYSMTSILVYCIYYHLQLIPDLKRWKEIKRTESTEQRDTRDVFWFRDWYHPIYEHHGDSRVLKNFFNLLRRRYWSKHPNEYPSQFGQENGRQLNMGEFVLFWSAAGNFDLRKMADKTFGWSTTDQLQFSQARWDYSALNYSCTDCDRWEAHHSAARTDRQTVTVVIAVLVSAVVILGLAFAIKTKIDHKKIKKLTEQIRGLTSEEVEDFINGNTNSTFMGSKDAHAPINSLPFNNDYEIPRERLVIDQSRLLGTGEFGLVLYGTIKGCSNRGSIAPDTPAAVKTPKANVEVAFFKALLSEIKIMAYLGKHGNIVSLLGTVTSNIRNREAFVAIEFCDKGNLLHHLQKSRKNFTDLWSQRICRDSSFFFKDKRTSNTTRDSFYPFGTATGQQLSTLDLIKWAIHISDGMAYLSDKNVIHGDLAARNILLTSNDVAKISDFGLSRQLISFNNYLKTSRSPLPWKWLAIESLSDQSFSTYSDIWSFGITLWEIFTLGKIPYPGRTWDFNFVEELAAGRRLSAPDFGGRNEIYNLMMDCMKKEPMERTPFVEIKSQLEDMKLRLVSTVHSSLRSGDCVGGRSSASAHLIKSSISIVL